jgi:hypothetical protein
LAGRIGKTGVFAAVAAVGLDGLHPPNTDESAIAPIPVIEVRKKLRRVVFFIFLLTGIIGPEKITQSVQGIFTKNYTSESPHI